LFISAIFPFFDNLYFHKKSYIWNGYRYFRNFNWFEPQRSKAISKTIARLSFVLTVQHRNKNYRKKLDRACLTKIIASTLLVWSQDTPLLKIWARYSKKSVSGPNELDKAIYKSLSRKKIVLCDSCDGVPLKFKKKNWWAFSLLARIIWA
jgi:hypothetical protein